MEEFDIISKIKYNNLEYLILLDNKHVKYYLKVKSNNELEYISFEEFIQLNKIYNTCSIIIGSKKINFKNKPLIKYKNGLISTALAISMAISLTGCAVYNANDLSKCGITISDGVIKDDGIFVIESYKTTFMKCPFMDHKSFDEYNFSEYCNVDDFSKKTNLTNISWNDIKAALNQNSNIPDSIKKVLEQGINNLQNNNVNINLAVLYFNIKNLKIEYLTNEEMNNNAGYFDQKGSLAKINEEFKNTSSDQKKENMRRLTLTHEILGHGSTQAYTSENGKLLCGVERYYLNIENGRIVGSGAIGQFSMEAYAEIITAKALNKDILVNESGYCVEMFCLQNLCLSNGLTYEDYANKGIDFLIEKMVEKGVKDPQKLIITLDTKYKAYNNGQLSELDGSLIDTMSDYYIDKYQVLVDKYGMSSAEAMSQINKWLKESEKGIEKIYDNGVSFICNLKSENNGLIISSEVINQNLENHIIFDNYQRKY